MLVWIFLVAVSNCSGLRLSISCKKSIGSMMKSEQHTFNQYKRAFVQHVFVPLAIPTTMLASLLLPPTPVFADDYGITVEAPTLYTGETIDICVKRGVLGACRKTQTRTDANDNDKSGKYMASKPAFERSTVDGAYKTVEEAPAPTIDLLSLPNTPDTPMIISDENDPPQPPPPPPPSPLDNNPLINKLLQQSSDNKEANQVLIDKKTFSASVNGYESPLSSTKMVMNADGKTFSFLPSDQYSKLKKQELIRDDVFVRNPTADELTETEHKSGLGDQLLRKAGFDY